MTLVQTNALRRAVLLAMAASLLIVAMTACERTPASPLGPTPASPPSGSPPVPGTGPYALTGMVFELTSSGPTAVADATVEVATCPQGQSNDAYERMTTGHDGMYRAAGICTGTTYVWAGKPGYRINRKGAPQCDGDCVYVSIAGDTRLDIELVRE